MPQITTIIPTFRRSQLLQKAIYSVLNQTYPDFQVCIYDNASNDETEEIVKECMRQDPRVKYHRHAKNIGMMANYAYALKEVSTPYFSLLSDDDLLLPHFYETALKAFQKHPEIAFSACGVKAFDEKGQLVSDPTSVWKSTGYFAPQEGIEEMITKPLLPVGVLFQRAVIKEIQPNLSSAIQIRWDTDYLLQIVERHPYFVDPDTCASFLAHAGGFSTGNYRQMPSSPKLFSYHVRATKQIIHRIEGANRLPIKIKKDLSSTLHQMLYRDIGEMTKHYLSQKEVKPFAVLKIFLHYYAFKIFCPTHLKSVLRYFRQWIRVRRL
jgi:glycosyltransferase involved in cell wall biosynthesis